MHESHQPQTSRIHNFASRLPVKAGTEAKIPRSKPPPPGPCTFWPLLAFSLATQNSWTGILTPGLWVKRLRARNGPVGNGGTEERNLKNDSD